MPAIQTNYSTTMQPGLEGACATTLNDDNSDTRICETVAGIPFGRVVSEGTNARTAVLGGASGLVGLSILDRTLVSLFGGEVCRQHDSMGVLFAGEMWVRVVAAVTHGAIATYDVITGQLNPAAGGVELYGSRYITSAGAGQVALLRLISSASGAEAEGGGAPDWVPENAVIHIDLVGGDPQGRAWVQGTGEVAVDTLLGSDPNTEGAWGVSLYDPAKLTADGYVVTDGADAPALIGTALNKLLADATIVTETKRTDAVTFTAPVFIVMAADGNDAIELDLNEAGALGSSYGGSFEVTISGVVNTGAGVQNRVAITLTSDRFDVAVNGSSAVAGSLASDDRPTGNPFVAAMVDPGRASAVQLITIYDPLPDTTGLSELSAL